jgi:hypothetical protein
MIYTLELKVNLDYALDYTKQLNTNFKHLHWWYEKHHNDFRGLGDGIKNNMKNVNGWGLQTIYNDPQFPYHCDIDPHDEGYEYFKDTDLVFGFFKDLKSLFVNPYRSFLMNFPSNHYIGKWQSGSGGLHAKVFVPIISNNSTRLISYNPAQQVITLNPGSIYVFDMSEHHGELKNDGDTDITFITFNIPSPSIKPALLLRGIV